MSGQTIRDRFWLWGMKVNALQSMGAFSGLGFAESRITTNEVMERTGVTNAIIAGGLPLDEETLASLPLAKRLLCKWSLHRHGDAGVVIDFDDCLQKLMDAKQLAALDTRIDGYHIDDFSTGSIDAGAQVEHIQRLLFENSVVGPRIPLSSTIYTMTVERPELPQFLPYFDQFLFPLWHADQIEQMPGVLARFADLSGNKPAMLCLYVYDFGNGRASPRDLMARHLAVAENLLMEQKVTGLCICGTCMMDLDWEANRVLFDWLEKSGDKEIG
jgi:hypothetical protein